MVLKQHFPVLLGYRGVFSPDPHRGFGGAVDDGRVHRSCDQVANVVADPHCGRDDDAHDSIRLYTGHATYVIEVNTGLVLEG